MGQGRSPHLLGGEGGAYHDHEPANLGGVYRTSEGVDIYTCAGCGNGYIVGSALAGEWLKYSITITTSASNYKFTVASSGAGGTFHLEDENGNNLTGALTVPNTGGWYTLNTITTTGLTLSSGPHVLKLVMDTNGATGFVGNFDTLTLAH